jgi:predicted Zn finger-like uncharacterized protein
VQAQCPQCAQRIVIDDAKVPEKPFAVKCPKCQTIVRLQGRGAAAAQSPSPEPEPSFEDIPEPPPAAAAPVASAPPQASAAVNEEVRAHMMAQLRREMASPGADAGAHDQALVCIPDRTHSAAITLALTRLGYGVESVDEQDEGARLVEQGTYAVVATARTAAAPGKGESPYQRITRLSSDQRRRIMVILVGDEFKTGDTVQAYAVTADLVVSGRDSGNADAIIRSVQAERKRLFQAYTDARRRFEASAS